VLINIIVHENYTNTQPKNPNNPPKQKPTPHTATKNNQKQLKVTKFKHDTTTKPTQHTLLKNKYIETEA